MNSLGIYFGPSFINIVESKGRVPINNIRIPRSAILKGEGLDEKVPEAVKIATYIKEELKKNRIEAQEAIVCLSGRDLIIRNFEMPLLPRQELYNAINFEVKKYIPFKIEDLVSDFQIYTDKTGRKNYVLFVGIKKDTMEKYSSIFQQLGIRIAAVEYSAFSTLRMLSLAGVREREVIAAVNIDLAEEDEINFVVLKEGFPLFSRDIPFISIPGGGTAEVQPGAAIERLKREIRVSLDYYDRTFPLKNIGKIFFIMNNDYRQDMEGFIKEIGLGAQSININKCIGKPVSFSLAFVKAYSASVSKVSTAVKVDLLTIKEKALKKVGSEAKAESKLAITFKSDLMVPLICAGVGLAVFMLGKYRTTPVQNEIESIKSMRPVVSLDSAAMTYEDMANTEATYKKNIKIMDELTLKQIHLTKILEAVARSVPKDVRLLDLGFARDEDRLELTLRGIANLGDSDKEIELVNTFLTRMKEKPVLNQYFKDIALTSVDYGKYKEMNVTNFVISCRTSKR